MEISTFDAIVMTLQSCIQYQQRTQIQTIWTEDYRMLRELSKVKKTDKQQTKD